MYRRGFTLIELLAVVIILIVIFAIAVPSISGIIDNAKQKSYDTQVNLIIEAARKYAQYYGKFPALNNSEIITLKELQDNNYIGENIVNSKTDKVIPSNTWVVIMNDNGSFVYKFGYEADGLLLQYDAIFNNGITNPHNDNASADRGVWKDLSGNNNDGVLTSYLYDSTSGWTNSSLKSATGTVGYVLQNTSFTSMTSFAVEVFGNFATNNATSYPRIVGTNGAYGGVYENINGVDICIGSTATTLRGYVSNGITANHTYISGIGNVGLTNITINWDYDTKKLSIYRDGVKAKEYNITLFSNVNFDKLGVGYHRNADSGEYNYYTVRVYNRVLTDDEISHNYALDRIRYGH